MLNVAISVLPADSSKENPYEDIEVESQCSQQSLPSSPGVDSYKVPAGRAKRNDLRLCLSRFRDDDNDPSVPRLRGRASSGRTLPGASDCWGEAASRPSAPAAAAAFRLRPRSALHPRPLGLKADPGCPGIPTAEPAAGSQRCVFRRLWLMEGRFWYSCVCV